MADTTHTDPPSDERPVVEMELPQAVARDLFPDAFAVPSVSVPATEQPPWTDRCERCGGPLAGQNNFRFCQDNCHLRPSLPVPDPPDDVLAALLGCRHTFDPDCARCKTMAPVRAAFERAGAVVVFGDGLPMGARLERDERSCCPHKYVRVLTDKEPRP